MRKQLVWQSLTCSWAKSVWLFFFVVCAQSAWAGPLPLWEVSGPRGKVYLFGSVHVCRADCFPLAPAVLKRFEASSALAVELDARRQELQAAMATQASYPAGDSLDKHLNPTQLSLLREILAREGIPEQAVMKMRPWMLAMVLTLTTAQRMGYQVDQGIDLWFLNQASAQGKKVLELETVERQLQVLNYGGDAMQIKGLELLLGEMKKNTLGLYLNELLASWRQGDARKIDALMRDDKFNIDEAWTAELLDRRNMDMASQTIQWLEQGQSVFVVVGVAHLVGKNSVPDILTQKGYKVRQVLSSE